MDQIDIEDCRPSHRGRETCNAGSDSCIRVPPLHTLTDTHVSTNDCTDGERRHRSCRHRRKRRTIRIAFYATGTSKERGFEEQVSFLAFMVQFVFGGVRGRGGSFVVFAPFLITIPVQLIVALWQWYRESGFIGMMTISAKISYWFFSLPFHVWKAALEGDVDYADAFLFSGIYLGLYLVIFFVLRKIRRVGLRNTAKNVWNTLRSMYDPRTMGLHWQSGGAGNGTRHTSREHAEKFDKVAAKIQKLPTEVFESKNVVEGAGTTEACCGICYEDYEEEDVLRKLPCGHKFHLECVDRWAFSSTDYSRPTSCPVCSHEI